MNKNKPRNLGHFVENVVEPGQFRDDLEIIIDSTDELYGAQKWIGYNFQSSSEYEEISRLNGRSFSPQEWRWEFTRRNEFYRRIYLLSKMPKKMLTLRSPGRLAEDIFGALYLTDPNKGVLHMRHDASEWEKGKSKSLSCPDFEGSVLFKNNYRPNRILYSNDPSEKPRFDHSLVFYASFDPLRDAKEQIEFIKNYLAEQQLKFEIRKTHRQFELWPKYLRILDAIDGGCGPTAIADLVGSHPEAVKASIKQAKRWVRDCLLIL